MRKRIALFTAAAALAAVGAGWSWSGEAGAYGSDPGGGSHRGLPCSLIGATSAGLVCHWHTYENYMAGRTVWG